MDNALVGRMVECGGCDARFRIDDEVVVRSRKFYPGERAGSGLNNFQRVPLSAAAPVGLQTMRYAELQNPEKLEPASAQRILAGVFGVAMMALTALLLIFAGGPGGAFDSMPVRNRLIVAGFVSLLGTTLLVYANPRARIKAGTIGLLLSAGVICLPFFFKGGTLPAVAKTAAIKNEPLFPVEDELDSLTALKERFTTKPLEDEQKGLEKSGEGKKAIGVFLIGLQPRNLYMIRDYLIRDSEAEPSSHPYPRDEGSYLMVLTGVTKSLDD
ncbi:MAG: hypothetical protein H7Y36_03620, partial [Armatimonadetes bacterium]|nr:hypothetical protein [Akkermansiaceae bacterium]